MRPMFEKESEMHKVYIALFTCATSRAIHLDLKVCFKRFVT